MELRHQGLSGGISQVFPPTLPDWGKLFSLKARQPKLTALRYTSDLVVFCHSISAETEMKTTAKLLAYTALAASLTLGFAVTAHAQDRTLINVSYDPTRELYQQFNEAFVKHWQETKGESVAIQVTHGGSGAQARSVIDGLEADVVTLALESDINAVSDAGFIKPDWRATFENNSAPYTSTIVFLVRKGNPKAIADWGDLVKDGVEVITPNPKTSGGARWNFLAAWGYALKKTGSEDKARDFVRDIYRNVPVLDSGARGSTVTFVERGIGDVFISWENEAFLALNELGKDKFEIVVPSISILAEPPVTLVDKVVDKRGTREVATAYLEYLYSPVGQDLAGKHYYRPTAAAAQAKYAAQFPKVNLFGIDEVFGGWQAAQKRFFADGGVFDQIYTAK